VKNNAKGMPEASLSFYFIIRIAAFSGHRTSGAASAAPAGLPAPHYAPCRSYHSRGYQQQ